VYCSLDHGRLLILDSRVLQELGETMVEAAAAAAAPACSIATNPVVPKQLAMGLQNGKVVLCEVDL